MQLLSFPPSKRAPTEAVSRAALAEAHKGKKKAVRGANSGDTAAKKAARDPDADSDADEEDKAAPPPAKKIKETPPSTCPPSSKDAKFVEAPRQQGFDLTSFMASFDPVPMQVDSTVTSELSALKAEESRLRGLLAQTSSSFGDDPSSSIGTAPNTKGDLPPSDVCYLTSASFPEGAKKAKGDYNPQRLTS
ncbi:hypothetical protein PHMEG_00023997 [Phytophthora megakarya]|uniref:Uncharacterized protein n=1 Tax=Phytophthora megakarya TaxID=4795 RepID=A0A225VF27_9STRA|nr:hypothetical protein PHMEG_00023997 [Phytophthora megakarya]